jgi:hypothetical protein
MRATSTSLHTVDKLESLGTRTLSSLLDTETEPRDGSFTVGTGSRTLGGVETIELGALDGETVFELEHGDTGVGEEVLADVLELEVVEAGDGEWCGREEGRGGVCAGRRAGDAVGEGVEEVERDVLGGRLDDHGGETVKGGLVEGAGILGVGIEGSHVVETCEGTSCDRVGVCAGTGVVLDAVAESNLLETNSSWRSGEFLW